MRILLLIGLTGCIDYDFTAPADEEVAPLDTTVVDTANYASVLAVTPESIAFGEVDLGDTESAVITLTNTGNLPLNLLAIEMAADGTPFTVGPPAASVLEPEASTEVLVTYAPVQALDHEGAVMVDSDATLDPAWRIPVTGSGFRTIYDVNMQLTADDSWTATLDGEPIAGGNQNAWSSADVLQFDLDPGAHVIAVHAWDVASVIAGFLGVVRVDGEPIAFTGGGGWSVTTIAPDAAWALVGFDDSAWATPQVCTAASTWGGRPTALTEDGAEWVWHDANCRSLGEAWFRLEFVLE